MTRTLSELREIATSATPGPWEARVKARIDPGYYEGYAGAGPEHASYWEPGKDGRHVSGESKAERDGAFIAAFNPQVVLALLGCAKVLKDVRASVLELECRADEDCDHCQMIYHEIDPALKQLEAAGVRV